MLHSHTPKLIVLHGHTPKPPKHPTPNSFVVVIYTLMSLCLVMMVPYDQLDAAASFATAFSQVGLPWGRYLVALGAVLGIFTGVLVRGTRFLRCIARCQYR